MLTSRLVISAVLLGGLAGGLILGRVTAPPSVAVTPTPVSRATLPPAGSQGSLGDQKREGFTQSATNQSSAVNSAPNSSPPIEVFQALKELEEASAVKDGTVAEVLANDPDGTLAQLGTSAHAGLALKLAVASWARHDASAAADWVRGHIDHPQADAMMAGAAKGIASSDTEAALEWVHAVRDPALRHDALLSVLERMTFESPEAALTQLNKENLPPTQMEGWQKAIRQPFDQYIKRTAQALSSMAAGASAGGNPLPGESIDELITAFTSADGVRPDSGPSKGTVFRMPMENLNASVRAALKAHLTLEGGHLIYGQP